MTEESSNQDLQQGPQIPDWVKATIAMRAAVSEIIEEHCKTGHPLIVWRDGKVYRKPPEEAKRELEQAMKNDPWASEVSQALRHP
jgi:hypothetical protein